GVKIIEGIFDNGLSPGLYNNMTVGGTTRLNITITPSPFATEPFALANRVTPAPKLLARVYLKILDCNQSNFLTLNTSVGVITRWINPNDFTLDIKPNASLSGGAPFFLGAQLVAPDTVCSTQSGVVVTGNEQGNWTLVSSIGSVISGPS